PLPRATTIWSRRSSGGSPLRRRGCTILRGTCTQAVHWNLAAGKTRDAGPAHRETWRASEMAMSDRGRKQLSRRELLASGLVAVPVEAGRLAHAPRVGD